MDFRVKAENDGEREVKASSQIRLLRRKTAELSCFLATTVIRRYSIYQAWRKARRFDTLRMDIYNYRVRRGVEQWQLVGLITRRPLVRIQPPLPNSPNPKKDKTMRNRILASLFTGLVGIAAVLLVNLAIRGQLQINDVITAVAVGLGSGVSIFIVYPSLMARSCR